MKIYMEKKERESNIELLRIISMVLVMVVHADFMALGIPSQVDISDFPVSSFMRLFTESVSIVCVNLFVLISGWFGIRFKLIRLGGLLFQVLFFCIVMCSIILCLGVRVSIRYSEIVKLLCEDYWFVFAYVILYLFAPALNNFVEKESKRNVEYFLFVFFFFQTIFGFIMSLSWFSNGYSPISFMGLYVLGRYLHIYPNIFIKQKQHIHILIYIGMIIATTCLAYLFFMMKVYLFKAYSYSSPFVIMGSISLFLFFTKMSFRSIIINWIGTSCFSIYLVHCFPVFFERVYLYYIKDWYINMNNPSFLIFTSLWITLLFILSVLMDKIRIAIWQKICHLFE